VRIVLDKWKRFLEESQKGTILAIFGPSGSGKSRQKNIFKENGWNEMVSLVTRPRRGEKDIEYDFATEEEWQKEFEEKNLINTNRYGGNFYGVRISDFRNATKSILVTDITNVDGSKDENDLNNVAAREDKRLILLFSAPPADKELIRRHKERLDSGEYSDLEEFETRVRKAREESNTMHAKVKGLSVEVHTIYSDDDAQKLARTLA